jgi:hypothetical protein
MLCENCEKKKNLQETAGNKYIENVLNFDLTEPWREVLLIWRMVFDQIFNRHLSKNWLFS